MSLECALKSLWAAIGCMWLPLSLQGPLLFLPCSACNGWICRKLLGQDSPEVFTLHKQTHSDKTPHSSVPVLKIEMSLRKLFLNFHHFQLPFPFWMLDTSSPSTDLKADHYKYDQTKEATGKGDTGDVSRAPSQCFSPSQFLEVWSLRFFAWFSFSFTLSIIKSVYYVEGDKLEVPCILWLQITFVTSA